MAMPVEEVRAYIHAALPDAEISIEDLTGDGNHYACRITSESFRGLSRVKQHRLVYKALKSCMGQSLHAMTLQTIVPDKES